MRQQLLDLTQSNFPSLPNLKPLNAVTMRYDLGRTLGTCVYPFSSREISKCANLCKPRIFLSGAFSEVKLAKDRETGREFAIKVIDKAKCKGKESMIETEVNILKRVRHENIIQLYEMYEVENRIYLVMELCVDLIFYDSFHPLILFATQ